LAEAIAAVLGWVILACATAAIVLAVVRRARGIGVLAPLLVGFGLRLVVMLVAHFGSLSLHDHGILFVDDRTHYEGAKLLAGLWKAGQFPDPVSAQVLGTFQFGYPAFVAVIFTLGTSSLLLGKLANVLLGTASVLLVARIAGNVLGERARVRAAWLAALAPTLVWWSAPLLKEALATTLVLLAVLAITELPRPNALVTLTLALAALVVVRTAAVLALAVAGAVAVAIAGHQSERRWLSRPLIALAASLAACLLATVLLVSHGDVQGFYHQYHQVVHRMIRLYQGSDPTRVPFDALKSLVTPLPWAFDPVTRNWDRGLYPGVWLLMCVLPLAALGAWRLRRRPEGWLLFLTIVVAVTANAFTSGFVFRQRSMIEPLILVLALAGARSWRMAAAVAAGALVIVAAVAGAQSHSPVVVGATLAASVLVALLSRRLPAAPFEPIPDSRMTASFRAALAGYRPSRGHVAAALAIVWRGIVAALASARASVVRMAPRLGAPDAARASREAPTGRVRWAPALALAVAFVVLSVLVVPRIHADGTPAISTYSLDAGSPAPATRTAGTTRSGPDGYVVERYGSGQVSFAVHTPPPSGGRHTYLLVWGGGRDAVASKLTLIDAAGRRHVLGSPATWQGHRVDVTPYVRGGAPRLRFAATNSGAEAQLIADQVRVATYAHAAVPRAGRWEVALWIALGMLLALAVLRRPLRDLVLVPAVGLAAYLAWPAIVAATVRPAGGDLAQQVSQARWLDLDHGIVSGTFGTHSALAVQLYHALTPIAGIGTAGVRTASLLVGVLVLVAAYALGARVAGAIGALAAVTFALLSDPFRQSLSSGDSSAALLLAGCLFLLAVAAFLERRDRRAMVAVGVAGALVILALPICWPGVVLAIVVLAFRRESRIPGRTALTVSLVALGLVLLPSRLSVAHQSAGSADADVVQIASQASNTEFGPLPDGSPRHDGLGSYLRAHSVPDLVTGTVDGASSALSATAQRPQTKLVGMIAFILGIAGVVALLVVPRLRLLVLLPAVVSLVPWFFVGRGTMASFPGGTMFWPALVVGAATTAHIAARGARERRRRAPRGPLAVRLRALAWRSARRPQPSPL
jgi:hypothetical protein